MSVDFQITVAMGVTTVHLNADLFKNPTAFVPERWLEPDAESLEQYLIPFSKGPRMCLGMQ